LDLKTAGQQTAHNDHLTLQTAQNMVFESGNYETFTYELLSEFGGVKLLHSETQQTGSGQPCSPSPRTRPSTPVRLSGRAAAAGTPLSATRQASLLREEQRARNIIAEAQVPDLDDVLQEDDWEDVKEDLDDEVEVPEFPGGQGMDEMDIGEEVPCEPDVRNDGTNFNKPIATGVPAHKLAENTPDPFLGEETMPLRPPVRIDRVHPMPGVFLIYMLVSWLHLQFHLPFRACNAVLGFFGLLMHSFGVVINPPALSTLASVLAKMELEPEFRVLPVCPTCLEVYPGGKQSPTICSRCSTFIYKARPSNARTSADAPSTPVLQFPFKSLESQLVALLAVPGVEVELDKWRSAGRKPGVYKDIYDGNICKDLKGHDGQRFFRNNSADRTGPNGELRIGVTLGVDWCVILSVSTAATSLILVLRFSYLRSQIAPSHSSCPMSYNIVNLPPYLRWVLQHLAPKFVTQLFLML
jgi:hypothetical protein